MPGDGRQRRYTLALKLRSLQRHRAGSPVEVADLQLGDLAHAQSEIQGQAHRLWESIDRP
jgi:hypothetical protein